MAKFCTNCGSPMSEAAKFCGLCGTPWELPPEPPSAGHSWSEAPTPSDARATGGASSPPTGLPEGGRESPKSTSPVLKIVVAVLGFFALATVLAVGSCFYLAYRARQKVGQLEQAITVPSPAARPVQQQPTPAPQPPSQTAQEVTKVTAKDGQCALFSKSDLTQLLGTNFIDAAEDPTGCTYKGGAPREWVRVEIHWTDGRKVLADYRNAYENLKKSMPAANIPVQPFPGVGDEAYVNLWNVVHVRKGETAIDFDLRYYHDSTDQTKAVIEKALAKL